MHPEHQRILPLQTVVVFLLNPHLQPVHTLYPTAKAAT